jgi:hypothetical protein
MCYSAEVSLFSFAVGVGFSALLFFRRNPFHRLLGAFLGFVSLMQFVEFLLWIHPVCDAFNKSVSVAGMILNHSQPIVLALLTTLFYGKSVGAVLAIVVAYTAAIIPYSMQFTTDLQCSTRQCGATDPHIVWNWNNLPYSQLVYSLFLAAFVGIALVGMPQREGRLFAAAAVVSYGLSSLIYERAVVGALWCFWTAFIPVAVYFSPLIY